MIRLVLAALALVWASAAAAQGLDDAKRRWFEVRITPEAAQERGAYVGGQLVLDIRLVSSDPFKRLRLRIPRIPGARVETLKRPHTLQINVFGGKGYSHQARYAIFPQAEGTLTLPPIVVDGIVQDRTGRTFEFTETYPEQRIAVHPMDPAFPAGEWVVSDKVRLEENWSSDVNLLAEGDTVRRTIVLTVAGARAEGLPPLDLAGGDGYRVLHTERTARTTREATGFMARVEQSWDLYVASGDVFHIAPVAFRFWDPVAGTARLAEAPARRVEPVRRDAAALRAALRAEIETDQQLQRLGVIALLAVPVLAIIAVLVLAAASALPSRADIGLWRAARRRGTPLGFYRAFQAWARRSLADRPVVGEAQMRPLGPDAVGEIRRMHRALFGRGGQSPDQGTFSRQLIGASIRMRLHRFRRAFADRLWRLVFGG